MHSWTTLKQIHKGDAMLENVTSSFITPPKFMDSEPKESTLVQYEKEHP